jgi:hypothetical protein
VQVFAESLRAPWSHRAHSAMARRNRLPLGARQHHPTLVLFTLRRTNADLGRSEKFGSRTSLQPGWLTFRAIGKNSAVV